MEHETPRSRRHSKRIPKEVWNQHREEITTLYQTMTVEQIMTYMRDRYNFTPTRRQYVHRLGAKWQLAKYNRKAQQGDESPRELSPQAPPMSQDPGPSSAGTQPTGSHQSTQVAGSSSNYGGGGGGWDAPYEYGPVVQPPLAYGLDYTVSSGNYVQGSGFLMAPDGGLHDFQELLPPSDPGTYPAQQPPR